MKSYSILLPSSERRASIGTPCCSLLTMQRYSDFHFQQREKQILWHFIKKTLTHINKCVGTRKEYSIPCAHIASKLKTHLTGQEDECESLFSDHFNFHSFSMSTKLLSIHTFNSRYSHFVGTSPNDGIIHIKR